jgi:hypothetical protein
LSGAPPSRLKLILSVTITCSLDYQWAGFLFMQIAVSHSLLAKINTRWTEHLRRREMDFAAFRASFLRENGDENDDN